MAISALDSSGDIPHATTRINDTHDQQAICLACEMRGAQGIVLRRDARTLAVRIDGSRQRFMLKLAARVLVPGSIRKPGGLCW